MAGAEPAWVDVRDPVAGVELEPDPSVSWLDRRVEQQRAGHPQVDQQLQVARQLPDEVLALAPDVLHRAATQRLLNQPRRLGPRPARVQDLDIDDRPALQVRRQLAADRLDFGQLGHLCLY